MFGRPAFVRSQFQQIVDGIIDGRPTGIFRISQAENIVGEIGDFVLLLGAAAVIISFMWAGISYLRAGADEQKVQDAKARLKWTLVGSVVIMGIGVILATISQFFSGSVV